MKMRIAFAMMCIVKSVAAVETNPLIIGAGFHVGQNKLTAQQAASIVREIRIDSVRDEVYWNRVQGADGELKVAKNAVPVLDFFSTLYERDKVGSVIPLGYGNKYITGGRLPKSEAEIAAYARYCGYVAGLVKGRGVFYEIWNEWNYGTGGIDPYNNRGTVDGYLKIKSPCTEAVKSADSSAKILGGVLSSFDEAWARSYIDKGGLKGIDGLSLHTYVWKKSDRSAEFAMRSIDDIADYIKKKTGGYFPIYITEMGWPTFKGAGGEVNSANEIVKFLIMASARDYIKGVWVYEMVDGGGNYSEPEDNFGLMSHGMKSKKMGYFYLDHFLSYHKKCGRRFEEVSSGVYKLPCGRQGEIYAFFGISKYKNFRKAERRINFVSKASIVSGAGVDSSESDFEKPGKEGGVFYMIVN